MEEIYEHFIIGLTDREPFEQEYGMVENVDNLM